MAINGWRFSYKPKKSDGLMVMKLNSSLDNIQKGTDGFNQSMEALKHNFLLRGYFRKQEKKKKMIYMIMNLTMNKKQEMMILS